MTNHLPFTMANGPRSTSFFARLWESGPAICTLDLSPAPHWPSSYAPVPGFFASLLIHAVAVFLVCIIPLRWFIHRMGEKEVVHKRRYSVVYYDLRSLRLASVLPARHIENKGEKPDQKPRLREPAPSPGPVHTKPARDPRVRIVSNPPRPDNNHRTILQPVPPELKITQDIRVPDLIIGGPPRVPEPPRPRVQPPPPKLFPPAPPVPVLSAAPLNANLALLAVPDLPPIPAPPPEETAPAVSGEALPGAAAGTGAEGNAALTSLLLDPALATGVIALPAGNWLGAFVVSPDGVLGGASGGGGQDGQAGQIGDGLHGNGAPGNGKADGSGGSGLGAIEVSGSAGVLAGTLPAVLPEALVFPVNQEKRLREPGMIVSTGPGGGAGLKMYGALRGGKIYTIYLPMPRKNWILEYCARDGAPSAARGQAAVQIQMEPLLVPPIAIDQFDFHRQTQTNNGNSQMIILQGVIDADGAVSELRILRGIDDIDDRAAMAAFARWKFKPAQRAGAHIAVQVLVGIPAGT